MATMRPDPHSGVGLVQQTVQIVASLRSHDLTLFVRRPFLRTHLSFRSEKNSCLTQANVRPKATRSTTMLIGLSSTANGFDAFENSHIISRRIPTDTRNAFMVEGMAAQPQCSVASLIEIPHLLYSSRIYCCQSRFTFG